MPEKSTTPDMLATTRRSNEAIIRRDFDAVIAILWPDAALDTSPNIEWDISAYPLPDYPDRATGRESFLTHHSNYLGGWNDYELNIRELLEAGSEVVAIMHERAKLRASDAVLERDLPTVWTITDGVCVRYRVFPTRNDALKAAGLQQ